MFLITVRLTLIQWKGFGDTTVTERNYISCIVGQFGAGSISFVSVLFHVLQKLVIQYLFDFSGSLYRVNSSAFWRRWKKTICHHNPDDAWFSHSIFCFIERASRLRVTVTTYDNLPRICISCLLTFIQTLRNERSQLSSSLWLPV